MCARKKEKHDNVMLLSMSSLPNPKYNTYTIKEGDVDLYFKSITQMEPHTKYVLYKLATMNETLDRVVILESDKARTDMPEGWGGETATTVYKKRIEAYRDGLEEDTIVPGKEDTRPDLSETALPLIDNHSIYMGSKKPEIIPINLEDPVYYWHAVNAIRHGSSETVTIKSHKTIHLYMDMQGGDRNTISQMNAIVELLGRQGVRVMGRYANDFARDKVVHTIRDASAEYRTYDIISAMDAFSRYGWGDSLKEYFKDKTEKDSKEERLIGFIDNASSAISKCDPDGFDNAIDEIGKLGEEFRNPGVITEMDVVYRDIEEDYRVLYEAKYRYVEQIRWCLDKKFLQQALTIFEAKMPHEFVYSGMIYYLKEDASEQERRDFLSKCADIYDRLDAKDHYRMKDLTHYLIKDYCVDRNQAGSNWFQDPENLLHFGVDSNNRKWMLNLVEGYRELCGLRNNMNHAGARKHREDGFFSYMHETHKNDHIWKAKNNKDKNYEKLIRNYLNNWVDLAESEELSGLRGRTLDLS